MTADQKLVAEATRFLEENRKHLPGVVARYLGELLGMQQAAATAMARQRQEIADLRALLYGNPDALHDLAQAGLLNPPEQVYRQGGWEDR
jgi:hypothetical protein